MRAGAPGSKGHQHHDGGYDVCERHCIRFFMCLQSAHSQIPTLARVLAAALSEGCGCSRNSYYQAEHPRPSYTYFHNKRILDAPRSGGAWRRKEIRATFGSHRPSPVNENTHDVSLINIANNKDNAAVTSSRVQRIKLIPDNNTGYTTPADQQLAIEFMFFLIRPRRII